MFCGVWFSSGSVIIFCWHAVGFRGNVPFAVCVSRFLRGVRCRCGGWELYSGREHLWFFVSVLGRSVDALAHVADEGRCSLRYSSGSWQTSCDPRVSEWGNPTGVVSGYPHLNV